MHALTGVVLQTWTYAQEDLHAAKLVVYPFNNAVFTDGIPHLNFKKVCNMPEQLS